jgi:hypothetical protein
VALNNLRLTLADADAFRTWAGVANQAAALARIYRSALPAAADTRAGYTLAELVALRPFAVVYWRNYRGEHEASGSRHEFGDAGSFRVEFEQDIAAGDVGDHEETTIKFENAIGQIIGDMYGLAGRNPYIGITGIDWDMEDTGIAHEDLAETQGNFIRTAITVSFEAGQG